MKGDWNSDLARTIASIGTPQFHETLVAMLQGLVEFDQSVIFAYYRDVPPIELYDNFSRRKHHIHVTLYQEGPYLLDPFFQACSQNVKASLYRLRDLAPDRFYQSEYFRSYYARTGLAEEIGYFADLPESVMVVVSLMRSDKYSAYSAREFRKLKEVSEVIRALLRQQHADLYHRFSSYEGDEEQSNIQRYIDHAFRTFGKNLLTPRERDVVEYVLKGNSSAAIGRLLNITAGTVQIHRKNIYQKLGINSQGELFSQFIKGLTS